MNNLVKIRVHDTLTDEDFELSEEIIGYLESVKITLEDMETDKAEIAFRLPTDVVFASYIIDSRLFVEGTVLDIGIGYRDRPEIFDTVFSGIIVFTNPEYTDKGILFSISACDITVLLNAPIVNSEDLKNVAKVGTPVDIVKAILDRSALTLKWKEDENKRIKLTNTKIPYFGIGYTDESIPDLKEDDDFFTQHRFVYGSNVPDWEDQTEYSTEYATVEETNAEAYLKALEQRGFELRTTYIDTIRTLEVACNRLFWYDSKEQRAYFKSRDEIEINNKIRYFFYGDGRYHNKIYGDEVALQIHKLHSFSPDYSSVDVQWALRADFVNFTKGQDEDGEFLDTHLLSVVKKMDTITTVGTEDELQKLSPSSSPVTALPTVWENNWEKIWKTKERIAPDAYQAIYENIAHFKMKEFNVTASGIVMGNPFIRPRETHHIGMVGNKYSGYWVTRKITHLLNRDVGFVTNIEFSRNVVGVPREVSLGEYIPKEIKKPEVQEKPTLEMSPMKVFPDTETAEKLIEQGAVLPDKVNASGQTQTDYFTEDGRLFRTTTTDKTIIKNKTGLGKK